MTGEDLAEYRIRLRLTQIQLADRLDVTPTTIHRWESNAVPISKAMQLALRQIETDLLAEMSRGAGEANRT